MIDWTNLLVYSKCCYVVANCKMDMSIMDIGMIEANTVILRKTVKYLNGDVKTIVEKRIIDNYKIIDGFFTDMEEEYRSIQSYEQQT